jgi:ApbE superfamily uncharacterized protein (UPF0280 family)
MYKRRLIIKETNILLKCDIKKGIDNAEKAIRYNRHLLEDYIKKDTFFQITFEPYEVPSDAPKIVKMMAKAGQIANVGPMASVAGAISEIATDAMLLEKTKLALAENGGDISAKGSTDVLIAVYAGDSPLSGKIGFKIKGSELPLGICTSSGKVGHSISLGDAHAATVIAKDAAVADAVATAVGNIVKENDVEGTIQTSLELAERIKEINGCLVIAGEFVGRVGKLPEIAEISDELKIKEWI